MLTHPAIIDLTAEPVCASCLIKKISDALDREALRNLGEPEGVKLRTAQLEEIESRSAWKALAPARDKPASIFGIPVWEVE